MIKKLSALVMAGSLAATSPAVVAEEQSPQITYEHEEQSPNQTENTLRAIDVVLSIGAAIPAAMVIAIWRITRQEEALKKTTRLVDDYTMNLSRDELETAIEEALWKAVQQLVAEPLTPEETVEVELGIDYYMEVIKKMHREKLEALVVDIAEIGRQFIEENKDKEA